MKWAVTDTDLSWGIEALYAQEDYGSLNPPNFSRSVKMDDRCFTRYATQKELEKDVKENYRQWAYYRFTHKFRSARHYRIFRKHYEIFCGGFLWYYDDVIRNKAIDHTVHFKWSPFSKKGDYSVELLLSPPPLKPGSHNHLTSKKAAGHGPSEHGVSANTSAKEVREHLSQPPSTSEAVDPPKPPPPPPPSME